MRKRGKKGQVTLFIIVAVIIVAIIVLLFVLRGRVTPRAQGKEAEPRSYIEDCVKQYLKSLTLQVEFKCDEEIKYCQYAGENIPYLCYSDIPYRNCIELHPEQIIEDQLEAIKRNVSLCINASLKEIEKKGYKTTRCSEEELEVLYQPTTDIIALEIHCPVTIEKEAVMSYEKFEASHPSTGQVSWGEYDVFKEAVQAIVKNESEGDLSSADSFFKIAEEYNLGLTIDAGATGSWTTIFILKRDNKEFKFAIKEVA